MLTAAIFLGSTIGAHAAPSTTFSSCLAQLKRIAVSVSPQIPQTNDKGCRVSSPVSLSAINRPDGQIKMTTRMLNKCGFTLQFAHWMADVANPLARQHLGSAIVAVRSGPGFVCRRRNNSSSGKLSEHALGNAIDISGFALANGTDFNINLPKNLSAKEARFLDALRKTACGYFTTVLGPGSNAAHATHLHLDMQIHGKTGTYRICE